MQYRLNIQTNLELSVPLEDDVEAVDAAVAVEPPPVAALAAPETVRAAPPLEVDLVILPLRGPEKCHSLSIRGSNSQQRMGDLTCQVNQLLFIEQVNVPRRFPERSRRRGGGRHVQAANARGRVAVPRRGRGVRRVDEHLARRLG